MPTTTPLRRRRQPSTRKRASSFEVPDDVVELESEDEVILRSTQRRRPVRLAAEDEDKTEEEESEVEVQTTGKRLVRKQGAKRDRQEEEDLQEDLDFLQSSPPPDKGRLRSKQERPPNERQKALEALKRRRASASGEPSVTPRKKATVVLSDSDSDIELEIMNEEKEDPELDQDEDSDEEIEEVSENEEDASRSYRTNALDVFQENGDDAEFIDDENEDLIGEPADTASIPIEFSALSRAKPHDLFKYAVEWMVQKKINPAFSSTDEIYDLTFRKLNYEVNGLANSKYSSSVWTADFTRALRARPNITIDEIGSQMRAITLPHCEACNRKTHPATFNITFRGKPYDKETLEPLAEDSEDSDDLDSDVESSASSDVSRATYDAMGERLPPTSKIFTLGRTCKANAQMAHTLHHWRYHLNSWVVDYLARKGHLTADKIVQRDGWSVRKREKNANKIVDAMESEGEIRKLHRLYKENVDFAMEESNEWRNGWRRR
ncbi:hypothetical protein CC78DRAFT_555703 [Lojkania enalia]|uniref:DUF4211 domain-containing protein n=1 Tax=Lojkania enalia TaxID=147567 RepID=A0A9P4MZC0_9PLEO|nr:hypothetical protein CC78DRAFT_555703 [Didymosphaeria enalia]